MLILFGQRLKSKGNTVLGVASVTESYEVGSVSLSR